MEYKASMDKLTKVITLSAIILFTTIALKVFFEEGIENALIPIGLGVAIILSSWIFAPQSYLIDNTDLTIKRPVGNVTVKLTDIKNFREVSGSETAWTIRTFGVGGLFGYYGRFYIPKIGSTTWYATQRKNRILITTIKDKKILITPDDISIMEKLKPKL